MKRLYLVDVSSMFFRAFYAIRHLNNPGGMPTNAVYGFLTMTIKLLRDIKPDYMAFCWDRSEETFRKEIDPRYKANRSEMPADLAPQIPYIRKVSDALGIPCFEIAGYEADDIIGTLATRGREQGLEVIIVSGDKDFGQLVGPQVTIYDTMKDIRYDEAGVLDKWGIEPRKVIDYLALVGDSSDNVAGVKGIGPKGAQTLLAQFESIEDIYARIDDVANKNIRAKLEAGKDEAFLSKKLVTIVCDMKFEATLEDLKLRPIARGDLEKLLIELDFKTLAKTLLGSSTGDTSAAAASASTGPSDSPATAAADGVPAGELQAAIETFGSGSVADRLSPQASPQQANPGKAFSFVRPASPSPATGAVSGSAGYAPTSFNEVEHDLSAMAKWLKPGEPAWGLRTDRGLFVSQGTTIARLADFDSAKARPWGQLFEEKKLKWRGFDLKAFAKETALLQFEVDWDQMLAAYVVRAGSVDDATSLFQLYNGVTPPELATSSELLNAHLQLEMHLRKKVSSVGQDRVLFELENPLVPILTRMEAEGIRIDSEALGRQSVSLRDDLKRLEKEIHEQAGETFNIASTKQLAQVLFEKMKMPSGRKTKTGYSTDNKVLENLAAEFPIVRAILQYREIAKLRSTYVDALPALINPVTGRVHTTFNQASTSTGRLSSTNPNLQNIPVRTERGNLIREAFIADQGSELISADYSQIELRILAHITDDPGLLRAFEQRIDIHTATAAEVFGVAVAEVTSDMRRKAKAVNFGLAYGQGAFGLADVLRIPRKEATEIINRYFARFSRVQNYMTETIEEAKKKGYVETLFGRRRYMDELFSNSPMLRKFGERAAINAPIQGTASDLVKKAMIAADQKTSARMLLQVHDELIFEATTKDVATDEIEIKKQMESINILKVPLDVNVGHGLNWNEAH